jgi:putative ABC transport system permease protein
MFKNYFKIYLRNLWKNRAFSFINIFGLTVGLTACFLIFLYVKFETGYDGFNSKANRIYRLVADIKTPSNTLHGSTTSAPMAINIRKDFPEVESAVRIKYVSFLVRKGDIKFQETGSILADSTLFDIFDFPLVYGNRQTALKEPMSIVFSETEAKKYFGNENPIGQTVLLTDANINATVTGIMKDIPENSQIRADMIVSMSSLQQISHRSLDSNWTSFNLSSYLLLRPGANPKTLESKLSPFINRYTVDPLKNTQTKYTLSFEALRDIYLHSTRDGNATGNINNVYILSVIAIFILFIACINFVNLTTARAADCAKEVGIRKVSGAGKFQLIWQFVGESVLICLVAFTVTVLLSTVLLPLFNQLAGKTVSTGLFTNYSDVLILFLTSVLIGLIAGIYPAGVLSSYKPVTVLRGRFVTGTRGVLLRKGLVITQFTISIALIIATIIVYKQLQFMRSHDLGFNKDQMMIINTNGDKKRTAFKESLSSIPGVLGTTFSNSVPGNGNPTANCQVENNSGDMQTAALDIYFVDFDFMPEYKMDVVAGRGFSKQFATDSTQSMIINETAAKLLGYKSPQDAIGKRYDQWGSQGRIIGVVKDFHYLGLQQEIPALSMRIESRDPLLSIKVSTVNLTSTIKAIEKNWNQIIPNRPFDYSFLDQEFDKQYSAEARFGNLFLNFAVLAIFIACMGLLGLTSYSTLQRTKEIGVRKVMGATVSSIVNLLSFDFIKLVGIAFVIASPLAAMGMHKWLQSFAYRMGLSWWAFVLAGLLALFVTLFTISFQTIKAAVANPVKSLRTE